MMNPLDQPQPQHGFESLIADIARRRNVLLRQDDPLLIAVTLSDDVLARGLARMEATVAAAQDQAAAGAAQQVAEAKRWSELMMPAVAEHIRAEAVIATAKAVEQISLAVEAKCQSKERTIGEIRGARTTILCAAAITIAVAAIASTLVAVSPLLGMPPISAPDCGATVNRQPARK